MKKLDLSRFHKIIPHRLSPDELDLVRTMFADAVVTCAAQCADNAELLTALAINCPPESGLPLPRVLGEGSTRRAWALPFGLVMKLERTDELEESEMEWRGSSQYLLRRRRIAAVGEVWTHVLHVQILPTLYGLLLGFGQRPRHPVVTNTEHLTALDQLRPDDEDGIQNTNLYVSRETGELLIEDDRFPCRKPKQEDRTLVEVLLLREAETWIGNLGINREGRYFLIDGGNHRWVSFGNDNTEFLPEITVPGIDRWQPCDPLGPRHLEQTIAISKQTLDFYNSLRAILAATAPASPQAASVVPGDG